MFFSCLFFKLKSVCALNSKSSAFSFGFSGGVGIGAVGGMVSGIGGTGIGRDIGAVEETVAAGCACVGRGIGAGGICADTEGETGGMGDESISSLTWLICLR